MHIMGILMKKNKINSPKNFYFLKNIIIFFPLLIYLDKRSPIAFDEGYYILQAKFILSTNDWIAPRFFNGIVLDRTIGIQAIIAFFQKIFGGNLFFSYMPNIFAGILTLYLTFLIHRELLGKKYAIISPIILSTTFLWINYFHMATQDIFYGSLVTLGILSSIKSYKTNKNLHIFFSGIWVGLAFMLKTYMIAIPIICLIPFLIGSRIINSKFFWIGIFIGFLPFTIWSYNFIQSYSFETYGGLYEKLITLSNKNTFTKPFYYYVWNLILNCLPWSLLSLLGFLYNFKVKDKLVNFFLCKYPLFIIILLSIFSTKTPYYPIQILPLISINAYCGVSCLSNKKKLFIQIIRFINFRLLPLILFLSSFYINKIDFINDLNFSSKLFIFISFTIFSVTWFLSTLSENLNHKIILLTFGPYLLFSVFVQNGIFTDRSKEIRLAIEKIVNQELLYDKEVEFIRGDNSLENETSKLIRIAIMTPKIGNGINSIDKLQKNRYAWTSLKKEEILAKDIDKIIFSPKVLQPWKLIYKD